MKKKIILFGAALAALATFTSCSSEGDPILDTPVEPIEPVVKGTPFKVRIGDGTTRADFSKTTTANLATFQLYGIQQTATPNYWMDGLKFTKSGTDWNAAEYKNDAWTATAPSWPVDNKDVVTNFYGFSDGVTDGVPAGVTPNITPTAQSFTFTFGEPTESMLYYARASVAEIQSTYTENQWNARINSLRESFKSTADVLDNGNLTDLLVTDENATGTEGTDGTLSLNFKHALSSLVIKAKFVADNTGPNWPAGSVFKIEWLRIYGLNTSGTYTFGSGWTFGNSETKGVYQKNFGEDDDRWSMTAQNYTANESEITYKTLVDAGEFMMIPQDYSARAYAGYTTPNVAPSVENDVVIELYGYFTTNGSSWTDKGILNYFPLKVKNNTFVAGKKHVVVLDLKEILNKDGGYVATPSQAGGS